MRTVQFVLLIVASLFMSERVGAESLSPTDASAKIAATCREEPRFVLDGSIHNTTLNRLYRTVIPCLEAGYAQTIIINSPGGDVWSAYGIYDALRLADRHGMLTTRIFGGGHSAAVILFLAGEEREISCHSSMLIHKIRRTAATAEDDPSMIMVSAERLEVAYQMYMKIVATHSLLSPLQVKELMQAEKYLYPEELVRYRLATQIIGC